MLRNVNQIKRCAVILSSFVLLFLKSGFKMLAVQFATNINYVLSFLHCAKNYVKMPGLFTVIIKLGGYFK